MRRRSAATLAVAMLLTLPFGIGHLGAQTTSASLSGLLRTEEGTPVVDAVVRARSEATGVVRTAITNREGRYRIDLLAPGIWKVWAQISEGAVSDPRTVVLRLQESVAVDFSIASARTERVVVTAAPPILDRARTGTELRIEGSQADQLPVAGRTITDLALLDSSVLATPPGNFYGERGSVFVVNGQSGRSNAYLVDGLDNNDLASGTTLNASFSQQVIREFVVLTHQYAPEFGRASGGILNILTERGTNERRGEIFLQGIAGGLSPGGSFLTELPAPDGLDDTSGRIQGGVRAGGPLKRDRAFWFAAFEHQDADPVIPYTGTTRDGVEGGWIVAPSRDDSLFARADFNIGTSNFLMLRLSGNDRSTEGLNVGGTTTPESGFAASERDLQFAATLTTILSPDLLNESRLLIGSSSFDQDAASERPGVERPSGTFGGNNLHAQNRVETKIQLVDNLTWKAGRHTPKAGVDLTLSRTRIDTSFNPRGNFLYETDIPFEPGDCGDLDLSDPNVAANLSDPNRLYDPIPCPGVVGSDDDLDGRFDEDGIIGSYPIVFQFIKGEPSSTLDDARVAFFAQDSFRVSDRFLLDYGLRYDLSTFTLPEETAVPSVFENGGAGRDWNNIAPRVGFSFTPADDGRTVLRGGAGIFYDKLVLGFPAVASITSGTEIGIIPIQGAALEITEDLVEQIGIGPLKQALFFPQEFILRFSTGTRLETPYTVQYSAGMERAAGAHGALTASVTRALGYHQALFRDFNPVADPNSFLPFHRDPSTGSIAAIVTEGRSWYTALDLGWRLRKGDRWTGVSYTWSKALDTGPDPLKGGIYLPPDSDDLRTERGRSDADRRHRFVVSGSTPLPWMGLRAAGVVQIASGAPFNVTTGGDENADGITTDRPSGVGRNTGESADLGAINRVRRAAGLSPIRGLSEPGFAQIDLRLSKPFQAKEGRGSGEVYLQIFNALNRFNGGPVDGVATSANFGRPVGQIGPPRIIELGLRLSLSPPGSRDGSGAGS